MAAQKKPTTVEIARTLIEPILQEMGLELWDVLYEKEGGTWFLRYFIEKESGLNIQDCVDVSRAVEQRLDDADPIEGSYTLEVSSPGIERALKKDWHYQRYIGQLVQVRLIRPVEGQRNFIGVLKSKENDTITIELDDELEMSFAQKEAAWVRLHVEIDIGGREI